MVLVSGKKHSMYHAHIDIIVNPFQSNFEKGMFTRGIFIDFKKAFDTSTVYHNILLKNVIVVLRTMQMK